MTDSELPILSPAEARILGCLIEKKELTPDIYPLTANAALAAANQKTAREPVMALEMAEVSRALATLQQKGLVRQAFASRVDRYEHLLAQKFSLTRAQGAIVGLLLLRGPQTAHELLARTERMASFASVEGVKSDLDLLIGRRPPLVQLIERGPGQREDRYAHLLSGPVEAPASREPTRVSSASQDPGLEARVRALEEQVAALAERLGKLAGES
ncbi:MAG: DUF480 domain-containing protein [Rhizobiales bacterium]|nr:DUF480 domain-containing protein [Hyphomicrobiales bacterium]